MENTPLLGLNDDDEYENEGVQLAVPIVEKARPRPTITFKLLAGLVRAGNVQNLREALKKHDTQLIGPEGTSVLHIAATTDSTEVLSELLIHEHCKALLNHQDHKGMTPAITALDSHRLAALEMLCSHGAILTKALTRSGDTALHLAARMTDAQPTKILLKYNSTDEFLNCVNNAGNEVSSSFPLQMAIFFNIIYFPVWLTTIIVMLPFKLAELIDLYRIILIVALCAAVVIEIVRLYMGYLGNLKENVPGLAGFWMLSLLLQAPLQLLLLHPALQPTLVECVCQAVMCSLMVIQLISGFTGLQKLAQTSSSKFHVAQFLTSTNT